MVIYRFRNSEEHEELLKKAKKMQKIATEVIECLEDHAEDSEPSYRHDGYHREDDDYEMRGGRYDYRRGGRRM